MDLDWEFGNFGLIFQDLSPVCDGLGIEYEIDTPLKERMPDAHKGKMLQGIQIQLLTPTRRAPQGSRLKI